MEGVTQHIAECGFGSLEEDITMILKYASELMCHVQWGLHNCHLLGSNFSDGEDEEGEGEGGFLDLVVSSTVMASSIKERRSTMRRGSSILDYKSTNSYLNVIKKLEKKFPWYYIHISDSFK